MSKIRFTWIVITRCKKTYHIWTEWIFCAFWFFQEQLWMYVRTQYAIMSWSLTYYYDTHTFPSHSHILFIQYLNYSDLPWEQHCFCFVFHFCSLYLQWKSIRKYALFYIQYTNLWNLIASWKKFKHLDSWFFDIM